MEAKAPLKKMPSTAAKATKRWAKMDSLSWVLFGGGVFVWGAEGGNWGMRIHDVDVTICGFDAVDRDDERREGGGASRFPGRDFSDPWTVRGDQTFYHLGRVLFFG
ncbi:hypothetical protein E4U52_001019 [Claviceps spartinae]|nr:hypothetical protein E4U52_001019 [Claviceps spartinae]